MSTKQESHTIADEQLDNLIVRQIDLARKFAAEQYAICKELHAGKNAAQLWQQIPVVILTGHGHLAKLATLRVAQNDR